MKKIFYNLLAKSIGFHLNIMSYVLPQKAIGIAHGYFSEPQKGRFSLETLPQTLQDAQLEMIEFENHKMQTYLWKGNENVILLVHGWESNSSRWKKMLPHLKKSGCTIVAIDGPAQGLSSGNEFTVTQIAEFMDVAVQKFNPKYVIAHSLGGHACLYYQYKYQNKDIQKMVVLGAPSDFMVIFNNFISLLGLNNKLQKALKEKYTHWVGMDLDQFSAHYFASQINVPGFMAHDVDDKIVLFGEAEKIAATWKNVQFEKTTGLGHKLHDDTLYNKIYEFLFEK